MRYVLGVVALLSAFWLAMTADSASAAPGDFEVESPEFPITTSCGGATFNTPVRFATRTSGPPTSDTDFDINVSSGIVPSFWIYVPGATEVYRGVTTNFLVTGNDIAILAGRSSLQRLTTSSRRSTREPSSSSPQLASASRNTAWIAASPQATDWSGST
jgi:hypothetical protein